MTDSSQLSKISHSEVESYLRCNRAHFYSYGMKIQRIPGTESDSLFRGTVGHQCLEAAFSSLKEKGITTETVKEASLIAVTIATERAIVRPHVMKELITCLMAFFKQFPYYGWTFLEVENRSLLEITDDLNMPFIPDILMQDPYGDVWVIDSKFVYDFYTSRDIELLPQLPKYFMGLRAAGYKVDKMAYSMYRYREQKDDSVEKYYQFKPVTFTEARLVQIMREQIIASDRIMELKKLPLDEWSAGALRVYNSRVCDGCSFRSLCVAELNDWQPNLVLNSEYAPKQRRESQVQNG